MELLGYRKCTDGDSEPDLPASVSKEIATDMQEFQKVLAEEKAAKKRA